MADDSPTPRDIGAPELAKRRRVQPRLRANSGYTYDLYVVDGSGPDRLLSDGRINTNQHAALLSFTVLLHKANMLGPKSPATERVTNSDPSYLSTKMAEAMKMVSTVIATLDLLLGKKSRMELVNICMLDHDVSKEADLPAMISALRKGLDAAYE